MKRIIIFYSCALLLAQPVYSQLTFPKLTIPVSFSGKIKLADSLQKAKAPDAAILKTFLPQYSPQFQDNLIEALLVLDETFTSENANDPNIWFQKRLPELIRMVRTQYPEITRPMIYKIFYTFCYSRKPELFSWLWPWDIEEILNIAYGQPKSEPTGPKYLKEAKVPVETVFSYYAYKTTIITDPWISSSTTTTTSTDQYSVKSTVYKLLRGGYSPAEIYNSMRMGGYRTWFWIIGFCYANSLIDTPVETIARILKNDRITNDELSSILSQVPEYKKPANQLKAQMAN